MFAKHVPARKFSSYHVDAYALAQHQMGRASEDGDDSIVHREQPKH